jgi:hypothetical protein
LVDWLIVERGKVTDPPSVRGSHAILAQPQPVITILSQAHQSLGTRRKPLRIRLNSRPLLVAPRKGYGQLSATHPNARRSRTAQLLTPRAVPHASHPWSLYGLQLGAHPLGIGQPTGYTLRGVSTMFPRPGYVLANSTCHDG